MSVVFSYHAWWRWFRDAARAASSAAADGGADPGAAGPLEPSDDVYVVAFVRANATSIPQQSDEVAQRPSPSDGRSETFLTRGMAAFRVDPEDAMAAGFPLYQHGAYVVMERAALSANAGAASSSYAAVMKRKWLYLVFPTAYPIRASDDLPLRAAVVGTVMAADHFSFVLGDGGRANKPVHLHLTQYMDWIRDVDGVVRGDRKPPIKNHLPLNLRVSANLRSFTSSELDKPRLQATLYAAPLHAALRRPGDTVEEPHVGGARRTRGRGRARALAARAALERDGAAAPGFAELWLTLPLRRLFVVGVRRGESEVYDFTVGVYDQLPHREAIASPAVTFQLPAADVRDAATIDAKIQARIAERMADWAWDDFVDPEPYPE